MEDDKLLSLPTSLPWHSFFSSGCLFSANSSSLLSRSQTAAPAARCSAHPLPEQLESANEELWLAWNESPGDPSPRRSDSLSLFLPDFFLNDKHAWVSYAHHKKLKKADLISGLQSWLSSRTVDTARPELQWQSMGYAHFVEGFADLQDRFEQGKLRKAVPYAYENAPFYLDPTRKAEIILDLLLSTLDFPLFIYGNWNSQGGILGATPEMLFFEDQEGSLVVPAVAGTRPRAATGMAPGIESQASLLKSLKERDEHQIVIEGILESLKEWKSVQVGETRELFLPTLVHLYTPIIIKKWRSQAEVSPAVQLLELIQRLHPTPALGAFPRKEGMEWLSRYHQGLDRRRLGAPFGMTDPEGKIQCAVSIRNLQWTEDQLYIGAGCGVVQASRVDQEWTEIKNKIQSVKKMLGWCAK